jgi:hypothetical protein
MKIEGFPMFKLRLEALAPYMQSNERMANPFDDLARKHQELQNKKRVRGVDKLDVLRDIAEVELLGGLYWDKDKGPYVPAEQLKACIQEGAKLCRKGKDVQRALIITESRIKLNYKGPRDLEGIKKDRAFWDQRMVRISNARILRTRPIFQDWYIETTVGYVQSALSLADMFRYIRDAGLLCGIGEGRGKFNFGRFRIASINGQKVSDEDVLQIIQGAKSVAEFKTI